MWMATVKYLRIQLESIDLLHTQHDCKESQSVHAVLKKNTNHTHTHLFPRVGTTALGLELGDKNGL